MFIISKLPYDNAQTHNSGQRRLRRISVGAHVDALAIAADVQDIRLVRIVAIRVARVNRRRLHPLGIPDQHTVLDVPRPRARMDVERGDRGRGGRRNIFDARSSGKEGDEVVRRHRKQRIVG